jgi:hypothetical protein
VAHQSAVEYGACRKAGSGAARLRQHQLKVDKRENIKKKEIKKFFFTNRQQQSPGGIRHTATGDNCKEQVKCF